MATPTVLEDLSERDAGKLGSLVRVEDLGDPVSLQGLLERLDTKIRVQRVGDPPGEDFTTVPVHDRHQVHRAAGHGNVGYVGRPHLVGMLDTQIPQQVGIDPVLGMRPTGVRLRIDRLDAHAPHQPLDAFAVDLAPLTPEVPGHRLAAVKRRFQVLLVDSSVRLAAQAGTSADS